MPAVLVASSVFERSAEHQSAQLGQPAARRVFVPHPVQDRTDDEVRALACAAADALVEALTTAPDRLDTVADRRAGERS